MTATLKASVPALGTIGVLMGGFSSEREVSLRSGRAVVDAMVKAGCRVEVIDISTHDREAIISAIRSAHVQVAFIALHGKFGEDGTVQSILDELNIPYTGSGAAASEITFNKIKTQRALRACGLPVADFCVAHAETVDADAIIRELKDFPLVVKPACEGSSFGVTIAPAAADLHAALKTAFEFGPEVIVERFIAGRELTVGILDKQVLPIVEIRPQKQFFDYEAKYQKGLSDYTVPADLPQDVARRVGETALQAYQALGCEGFSRVDFRLDAQNRPFILEINTIPGFTETSLFPKAAREAGIDFTDVCLKLIQLAYGKKK